MTRRVGVNLLLASGAFLTTLIAIVLMVREPMTRLTPELLESSRRLWKEAGVGSYDLSYRMHGSAYDLSVRDGIVIDLQVNGQGSTTADPRAYAIDGLFDTLSLELDNLDDPAGPFAGRRDSVLMRVRFHDRLGYPERYLRSGGGQARGVVIEDVEMLVRD